MDGGSVINCHCNMAAIEDVLVRFQRKLRLQDWSDRVAGGFDSHTKMK